MKHLFNNLSSREKNEILEKHSQGGKNIVIENFNKLVSTKSGNVKPFLNEQGAIPEPYPKPPAKNYGQQGPVGQDNQPQGDKTAPTPPQGEDQEYIVNNLDDLSKVIYQMVNVGGEGRIRPVNGTSWAFNGVGAGWYIRLKKDDGSTITFTKK